MRVLQLGAIPPPHGGVQANMSAIAERLRHFGHIALSIATSRSSEIARSPDELHPQNGWQLFKLLFTLRADIVHLHIGGNFTLRLAALAFVCGVLPGRKSVLTFHSGGFADSEIGKAAKPFSLRGFAVRRLDKIIVVNKKMRELFENYGVPQNKIVLVAPFVLRRADKHAEIPAHLKNFVEAHSPLLFTASWLEPHYDVRLQIEVLELLKPDFPNIGLLVAGSGHQESELKTLAAAEPFADMVLLAGDVKHETVLQLIECADVLLRTTHFDGDAISIREALFLGTPVVATDNKMRPESVFLFDIGDINGLRQAIVKALAHGKTAAPETADGWKNIDQVLQIYQELLQTKSSGQTNAPPILTNPKSKT